MKVYQLVDPATGTRGPLYEADSLAEIVAQCADMGVSDDALIILLLEGSPTGQVYASQAPLLKLSTLRGHLKLSSLVGQEVENV